MDPYGRSVISWILIAISFVKYFHFEVLDACKLDESKTLLIRTIFTDGLPGLIILKNQSPGRSIPPKRGSLLSWLFIAISGVK